MTLHSLLAGALGVAAAVGLLLALALLLYVFPPFVPQQLP